MASEGLIRDLYTLNEPSKLWGSWSETSIPWPFPQSLRELGPRIWHPDQTLKALEILDRDFDSLTEPSKPWKACSETFTPQLSLLRAQRVWQANLTPWPSMLSVKEVGLIPLHKGVKITVNVKKRNKFLGVLKALNRDFAETKWFTLKTCPSHDKFM